ncbi:LuxR C-terminal-related transcriptional regulator [Tepidamorphus sp. 3E244]|uniref:LuxR C-terminal-related transcriptional regulator n=1 Tax=Tepidamorphus sp. 3E244 TaxID=3385498 RepID=UPI0038FCA698
MDRADQEGTLSAREREIAQAYASGDTYHQIAKRLVIAPSTVRTHLATIYRKLGVSSKIALHGVLSGETQITFPDIEESAALISELALSLEEAISRERALAAVLRIIGRTNGQLQEVMAAVLEHALELCDASFGILFEYAGASGYRCIYSRDISGSFANWLEEQGSFRVSPQTGLGRVETSHSVVSIPDVRAEAIYKSEDPLRYATADLGGARSFAAIPMLAGEDLIGAFTVYRQSVRPFDRKALDIASMFADQSVIAIQNARLVARLNTAVQGH